MAVFCLATDIQDLKARLSRIVVAYNFANQPVTVKDLGVEGALTLLLKDALKPNLVQTLENTPAIIHGDHLRISLTVVTVLSLQQWRQN